MARFRRKHVRKEPIFGWDYYNKLKKEKEANTVTNRQYLYLMRSEIGLFKIGISTDPRARLSSVISSSGIDVELIAFYKTDGPAKEVEKKLHKLFQKYRVRGEWFAFPDTYSLEKFETLCGRYGMTPQSFLKEDGKIKYDYETKDKEEEQTRRKSWLEFCDKMNKEWEDSKKKDEQ